MCIDRNNGADYGRVLVGLQMPTEQKERFQQFLEELGSAGYYFIIDESNNPVYKHFLK